LVGALHAEAFADFERMRVEIVNPALESRPLAMELKRPQAASLELDDLTFDLDDGDLIEAVPTRPVSARPIIAPSSAAKSNAPQVRQGLAKKVREEDHLEG